MLIKKNNELKGMKQQWDEGTKDLNFLHEL